MRKGGVSDAIAYPETLGSLGRMASFTRTLVVRVFVLATVAIPCHGLATRTPTLRLDGNVPYWGINVHFSRTGTTDREIDQVAQAYSMARMDLSWDSIELAKGKYTFAGHDELLERMIVKGIHPYLILDYGNQKLYPHCMDARRANTTASPACIQAFVAFAVASMEHFSKLYPGTIFELWNEPNTVFWEDRARGNISEYARLATAMNVARVASGIRTSTMLVGPAVAGFGNNLTWDFLGECAKLGCFQAFDAVSVHAYRNSELGPESILPDLQRLRGMLPNDKLPIISGEWGWSTCNSSQPPANSSLHFNCGVSNSVADEAGQARNLARQWLTNTLAGVLVSIFYDYIDDCPNPFDRECRFGTVRDDHTPKPSYVAAWTLQRYLGGRPLRRRLETVLETAYVLEFEGSRFAVWSVPAAGFSKNDTCPTHKNLPTIRRNCGHRGTTELQCKQAGCCFSLPPPPFGPQCFHPPLNSTAKITFLLAIAGAQQCWNQVTLENVTLRDQICTDKNGEVHVVASETPFLLAPLHTDRSQRAFLENKSALKFDDEGVFTIAQIADVHTGEGEHSWGPRVDDHTYRDLRKVLSLEAPLSLAVLSGDMLTGLNIDNNATAYWDKLVAVLDEQKLPHTAILGNHDAEPFSRSRQNQSSPGAKTNRTELMQHDTALLFSRSKVGPKSLRPAVSVYVVDVYSNDGLTPLLQLYHLDSGGGGMIEEVFPAQLDWFQQTVEAQRERFKMKVPALVFIHIPMAEFKDALVEKRHCFGDADDGITPTVTNTGLFAVLDATEEVKAVFVGHDHCNDFCCQFGKRAIDLCFARHSGYGGYQCDGYGQGVRIITIKAPRGSPGNHVEISTHIRMMNSSVVHKGDLV